MTGTIKIDWGLEVVGDTKDTDFFYARLRPVVNFKRGRLSEEEIAKMNENYDRLKSVFDKLKNNQN